MWLLSRIFSSSIGGKVIMALTGLFLCLFLIVHLAGNLLLLIGDEGWSFNHYAVNMTTNPFIKVVSYGTYFFIVLHAIKGLLLVMDNRSKRPVGYAKSKGSSPWASRNMGILGTILLVFVAVHMGDFWYEYKFGHLPYKEYVFELGSDEVQSAVAKPAGYTQELKKMEWVQGSTADRHVVLKDLQAEVAEAFSNPWMVLFYVLSMSAVSFHLVHGFRSAFQSLGLNHKGYNAFIRNTGIWLFGILIPAGFALIPLWYYFS